MNDRREASAPLRIAVVGAGFMGANHARVVASHPATRLMRVVDVSLEAAQRLADQFGVDAGIEIERGQVDAAVVATSTAAHVGVALQLLELGIPVLLEKPMATDLAGVYELVEAAQRTGTPLVCGFVERFNAAVRTTQLLLEEAPTTITFVRHSPFNDRATASVVQDLLIHDLDLLCRLSPAFALHPESLSVAAFGRTIPESSQVEAVDAILSNGACVANCSASRLGQRKVRTLVVGNSSQLVETDLFRQTVTMYRHVSHALLSSGAGGYRAETVIDTPYVRHGGEPLFEQLSNFCEVVSGVSTEDTVATVAAHVLADSVEKQLLGPTDPIPV